MYFFFYLTYAVVGLVQLFAIIEFFEIHLDWGFFDVVLALMTAWFPFVGSVLGVLGAMDGWNWSIWQAGLLFFWFIPATVIMLIFNWLFNR